MRVAKKKAYIFIFIFFLITIRGSYQYFYQNQNQRSTMNVGVRQNNINNMNLPRTAKEDTITYLQEKYQNEDIKATITIDDDDFTYPVVQTIDNDYYLTHDYAKNKDALGAIYADYRINLDTSRKILIFGHSSTIRETPFNELEKYYDESFFQKHHMLTLETKNNTYHYEIFSVHIETTDFTYMNLNFESSLKWYAHIRKLQERSWYHTEVELKSDDDILILQTCSNHPKYKNNKSKYLLIVSRRVK